MKKMKKIFAALFAMVMVLAMGMTVSAANITIEGGATGSEYAAYKLLNATDGGGGKFAYTVNSDYSSVLQTASGKTTDKEIVSYIEGLNTEELRIFADKVYAAIIDKKIVAEMTTVTDKFEGIDQGYYLIAETKTGSASDTYSLVMLDTAGNDDVKVTTKEGVPSLEKKVMEKNDSTGGLSDWQDAADYDIGDDVPFKLTGTLPSNYADYGTYSYTFHDEMSKGLTFNPDSVVVKISNNEIKTGYTVETTGLKDGCSFEVRFANLKELTKDQRSFITVEFTAQLNNDAVIGSAGNPNEAYLEYSNNPYEAGTGVTPKDRVIVFTYNILANKIDTDKNPLKGAGFTLYKFTAGEGNEDYKDIKGTWKAIGGEIKGADVTTFEFKGQDAGYYKLVETTVPAGYNKADDLEFVVEATYDTISDAPGLQTLVVKDKDGKVISGENLTFTAALDSGSVSTNIVNQSGTELPATGGIGTKIFYTIGAILMIGAAVLLITRKRSKK